MKARLAAGNWKMNGLVGDLAEVEILIDLISQSGCDVLICPPATLISRMHQMAVGSELTIGAQDCHHKNAGAHRVRRRVKNLDIEEILTATGRIVSLPHVGGLHHEYRRAA